MKTLENGEITQVTFACLTVFVSKAKCLLITSNIPIICALQQVCILGYSGIQLAECKYGCWYSLLLQSYMCEPSI